MVRRSAGERAARVVPRAACNAPIGLQAVLAKAGRTGWRERSISLPVALREISWIVASYAEILHASSLPHERQAELR